MGKYFDNSEFLVEFRVFKETNVKTEKLGEMLLKLAKHKSTEGKFSSYTWKDEMISESIFTCLRYLHKFDEKIENPNPWGYFSKIIHNSFLNYISQQKKHSVIKDTCYNNLDFIQDGFEEDETKYFNIHAIDYQLIVGNKKRRRRKKRKKKK